MFRFTSFVLWTLSFLLSSAVALTYQLDTSYSGKSLFDGFDFFTDPDPTHGFVTYVSKAEASRLGLAGVSRNDAAYLWVDHWSRLSPAGAGRKSVRITSKKSWTHGLFVADIAHMPGGICGTWPAWWTFGPNWPNNGEIDIIEGVNSNNKNTMALHTSANCRMIRTNQLGTPQDTNCDGSTNQNAGCSVRSNSRLTYGNDFNAIGGGIYAMEWTSQDIKIWFFPRNNIPQNLQYGRPDTKTWGTPQSYFAGNCNIDSHFKSHNIVFDTTFCGDWAANVWSSDPVCSKLASTCNSYVANNPSAFKNAYWSINSVKVYTSTASRPGRFFATSEFVGNETNITEPVTEPVTSTVTESVEYFDEAPASFESDPTADPLEMETIDVIPEVAGKANGGTVETEAPIEEEEEPFKTLDDEIIDAQPFTDTPFEEKPLETIDVIPELAGKENGGIFETGIPVDKEEEPSETLEDEFIDAGEAPTLFESVPIADSLDTIDVIPELAGTANGGAVETEAPVEEEEPFETLEDEFIDAQTFTDTPFEKKPLDTIDVIPELAGQANGGSVETGTSADMEEEPSETLEDEFIDAQTFTDTPFEKKPLETIDVIPELAGKENGGIFETGIPVDKEEETSVNIQEEPSGTLEDEFIDYFGPTHTFTEPSFEKKRRGLVSEDEQYFDQVRPALHTMTPDDQEVLEDALPVLARPRKHIKPADGRRKSPEQFGDLYNSPTDQYSDLYPESFVEPEPEGGSARETGDEDVETDDVQTDDVPEDTEEDDEDEDEIQDKNAAATLKEIKGDLGGLGSLGALEGIFKKERRGLVSGEDEDETPLHKVQDKYADAFNSEAINERLSDHTQPIPLDGLFSPPTDQDTNLLPKPLIKTQDETVGSRFRVNGDFSPLILSPQTEAEIESSLDPSHAEAIMEALAPHEGFFKKDRRGLVDGDEEKSPLHKVKEKYDDTFDEKAINERLSEHNHKIHLPDLPHPRPLVQAYVENSADGDNSLADQVIPATLYGYEPAGEDDETPEVASDPLPDFSAFFEKKRRGLIFGHNEDSEDEREPENGPAIDYSNIQRRPIFKAGVESAVEEMDNSPPPFVLPPDDDYLIEVEQQVREELQDETEVIGALVILMKKKRDFVFGNKGFKLPLETQSPPETDEESNKRRLDVESLDERLEDPDQVSHFDDFDPGLPQVPEFEDDMDGVGSDDSVEVADENLGDSTDNSADFEPRSDLDALGPEDVVDGSGDNTGESEYPPEEPEFSNVEVPGDTTETLDKKLQNSTQTPVEPQFNKTMDAVGPKDSDVPLRKVGRRQYFDVEEYENYPEAQTTKLDEDETRQLQGELNAGEERFTKDDKAELDRPDQTQFGEFIDGYVPDRSKIRPKKQVQEQDDMDMDEPVKGFPILGFADKMKDAISVISEHSSMTHAPHRTVYREFHHETQVVSRNVEKEIYIVNGVAMPTPPPRFRPFDNDEDEFDGGIPSAWLRGASGEVEKRQEKAEDLSLPLLNGGVGAGTPQGQVVDANLGVSAAANVGVDSTHGLPLEAGAGGLVGGSASLEEGPISQGTPIQVPETQESGDESAARAVGSGGSVVDDASSNDATHGIPISTNTDGPVNGTDPVEEGQELGGGVPVSGSRIGVGAGLGGAASLEGNSNEPGSGIGAGGLVGGAASLEEGPIDGDGLRGLPLGVDNEMVDGAPEGSEEATDTAPLTGSRITGEGLLGGATSLGGSNNRQGSRIGGGALLPGAASLESSNTPTSGPDRQIVGGGVLGGEGSLGAVNNPQSGSNGLGAQGNTGLDVNTGVGLGLGGTLGGSNRVRPNPSNVNGAQGNTGLDTNVGVGVGIGLGVNTPGGTVSTGVCGGVSGEIDDRFGIPGDRNNGGVNPLSTSSVDDPDFCLPREGRLATPTQSITRTRNPRPTTGTISRTRRLRPSTSTEQTLATTSFTDIESAPDPVRDGGRRVKPPAETTSQVSDTIIEGQNPIEEPEGRVRGGDGPDPTGDSGDDTVVPDEEDNDIGRPRGNGRFRGDQGSNTSGSTDGRQPPIIDDGGSNPEDEEFEEVDRSSPGDEDDNGTDENQPTPDNDWPPKFDNGRLFPGSGDENDDEDGDGDEDWDVDDEDDEFISGEMPNRGNESDDRDYDEEEIPHEGNASGNNGYSAPGLDTEDDFDSKDDGYPPDYSRPGHFDGRLPGTDTEYSNDEEEENYHAGGPDWYNPSNAPPYSSDLDDYYTAGPNEQDGYDDADYRDYDGFHEPGAGPFFPEDQPTYQNPSSDPFERHDQIAEDEDDDLGRPDDSFHLPTPESVDEYDGRRNPLFGDGEFWDDEVSNGQDQQYQDTKTHSDPGSDPQGPYYEDPEQPDEQYGEYPDYDYQGLQDGSDPQPREFRYNPDFFEDDENENPTDYSYPSGLPFVDSPEESDSENRYGHHSDEDSPDSTGYGISDDLPVDESHGGGHLFYPNPYRGQEQYDDDVHCTEPGCGNGAEQSGDEYEQDQRWNSDEDTECDGEHCNGGKEHYDENDDGWRPPYDEDEQCPDGKCEENHESGDNNDLEEHEHCPQGKCHGGHENNETDTPDHKHGGWNQDSDKSHAPKSGEDKHHPEYHEVHEYYTTIVTTTYVDLCKCAEKSLETFTHTTTIEVCDCEYSKNHPMTRIHHQANKVEIQTPECPMTTVTKSCNACGPAKENIIVVTIPQPPGPHIPVETITLYPQTKYQTGDAQDTDEGTESSEYQEICEDESCKEQIPNFRRPMKECEGENCRGETTTSQTLGDACDGENCEEQTEGSPNPGQTCEEDDCNSTPSSQNPYPICEGDDCKQKSTNSSRILHICEGEFCQSKGPTGTTMSSPTSSNADSGSCGNSGCSNNANPGSPDDNSTPLEPAGAVPTNATVVTASSSTKLHTPCQIFCFAIIATALLFWLQT